MGKSRVEAWSRWLRDVKTDGGLAVCRTENRACSLVLGACSLVLGVSATSLRNARGAAARQAARPRLCVMLLWLLTSAVGCHRSVREVRLSRACPSRMLVTACAPCARKTDSRTKKLFYLRMIYPASSGIPGGHARLKQLLLPGPDALASSCTARCGRAAPPTSSRQA